MSPPTDHGILGDQPALRLLRALQDLLELRPHELLDQHPDQGPQLLVQRIGHPAQHRYGRRRFGVLGASRFVIFFTPYPPWSLSGDRQ